VSDDKIQHNFKAGGLLKEPHLLSDLPTLSAPDEITIPRYVDSRPLCLSASNQGSSPHCAGYTMAGYLEIVNWKSTGIASQVDGDAIYAEAKTIDGSPGTDGTSLTAVFEAAKSLDLIDSGAAMRVVGTLREVQFALHRHGACLLGFDISDNWNSVGKDGWIADHNNPLRLGGHAVLACYYVEGESVGIQNSWSADWGYKGFGRMTEKQFNDEIMYGVVIE
jgi:hypothetical protein